MTLFVGQVLQNNRYRIEALLGQGGMGAVYRAIDLNLNIPVAIKENLDASSEAQKQFGREAQILARLSHPNLPRVTDYFFIPGQGQYLVMDFIEGEDLQSMLRRLGKLPEPQVLNWISQICDALAYLHSQPSPIIHRDIKPANIKIRSDGRAVLVDFGIAKVYDPYLSTTTGARAITPGYSPPEQYGAGRTDARSDIYALGATLYHLLTGQQPPESVQRVATNTPLPLPHDLNRDISLMAEQAILKAIEVATDRRFQNVNELRSALTQPPRSSGGRPLTSPAAPAHPSTAQARQTGKPAEPKSSHLIWLQILGGLGLLVVGVLIAGILMAGSGQPGAALKETAQLASTATPTLLPITATFTTQPTLTPTIPTRTLTITRTPSASTTPTPTRTTSPTPTPAPLISSVGLPTQLSPANGTTFNIYPRTTTFQWSAVAKAVKYGIELDCYHCCASNKWCSDVNGTGSISYTTNTSYSMDWYGAQPGRWRVWGIDASNQAGPKTGWWEFTYSQ